MLWRKLVCRYALLQCDLTEFLLCKKINVFPWTKYYLISMILFLVKSSSNGSRPPSTDKELYMPVTSMKYAKCAAGAVGFRGVFTFFFHMFFNFMKVWRLVIACCLLFLGKLVVCGGYDRGECLNKVEAYDVSTNSWEKWPPMLCKRYKTLPKNTGPVHT